MTEKVFTLFQLADKLGAKLQGDGDVLIQRITSMNKAGVGDITFLSDEKYVQHLAGSKASAVIIAQAHIGDYQGNALIMANPYLGFALAAQALDTTPAPTTNVAPSAVIDGSAKLGENVSIGATAVVEAGAVLGDNVEIGAGCFIGRGAHIGANCRIWPNVTIYHDVKMGTDCIIHSGAVIGSDGFGNAPHQGRWIKIPQLGSVVIGNWVEIGSNTCVDRGTLGDTKIADGVKIDNLCQIAHNVEIGENTVMAGAATTAGSLKVGKQCMIGGASVLNGHMSICDNVTITGMAMVMRPIDKPGMYSSGIPVQSNKEWRKMVVRTQNIDKMHKRISQLEKQLKELKDAE